jgi:hypothetical protein
MTEGQMTTPCPQCGSAAAVHAISELAALARNPLNQPQPGPAGGTPQGYAAGPQTGQQGWNAEPQAGAPQAGAPQGWNAEPQAGPPQGWNAEPQAGPPPGRRSGGLGGGWARNLDFRSSSDSDGIEDVVADIALGAVTRFIGRKAGRRIQQAVTDRVQQVVTDRVLPAMAARQAALGDQAAIAERHPDLRACFTDKVIFLAGGSRVVPLDSVGGMLTMEQADALVAQLREG